MDIISSPLRETVGSTEQYIDVPNQIELSSLDNSTTAEVERGNSESVRRDVLVTELRNETNKCKIFKVTEHIIRDDNFDSFKPRTVSIGPYNYGSSLLEGMEPVKSIFLKNITRLISGNYFGRDEIEELQNEIKGLQNRARSFYTDNIAMTPDSFTKMLLHDGCFILAALTGMKHRAVENMTHDAREALNRHDILHDLLLVENQIPFFVLEEIHKKTAGEGETTESLKKEIATGVERVLQQYPKAIRSSEIYQNDFHHLVHLCHMFFRPSPNSVEHHHDQAVTNQWHRAKQYHEAGIRFRVKPSSTGCSLLDVTFSNGTMKIPHLSIDANTESIFSNLILFEKLGCPHAGTYINAYITFMSKLLGTADDVELLVRKGIIGTLTGRNEQVATTFVRLNTLAVFDCRKDYYLKSVLQSVEAHYRWRPNRWMQWLKRNRLTNPFVALATLGGIIILICTVIQTLFAILQFSMRSN